MVQKMSQKYERVCSGNLSVIPILSLGRQDIGAISAKARKAAGPQADRRQCSPNALGSEGDGSREPQCISCWWDADPARKVSYCTTPAKALIPFSF